MTAIKNNADFNKEVEKLDKTISIMEKGIISSEEQIKKLRSEMRKFNPAVDNVGLLYAMQETEEIYCKKIRDYERNKGNPYFSSIGIIFKNGDGQNNKFYIGKCSISGENNAEIEVIDWRTPIASVYYDGRLGEVSYEAPEGTVECTLTNKRMYTIKDGILQEFSDVDVTANDELLKPYLNASSDNRLKNIISTIQAEQNRVIRANIKNPLIVQGVAGSGKTTAALHRIAYLVYDNEKTLKPSDFMIIAPNKLFLDYISEVLPDLGVENVNQLTFEEFASEYLEVNLNLKSTNTVLLNAIEPSEKCSKSNNMLLEIAALKSSLKYKDAIDNFLSKIEELSLPDAQLNVADVVIASKEELLQIYREECSSKSLSLDEKFKLFLTRLSSYIQKNYEKIENIIIAKRSEKIEELKRKKLSDDEFYEEKLKVFDEYEYRESLKNNGKKLISQYGKLRKKRNVLQYYSCFIEQLEKYVNYYNDNVIEQLKEYHKESKNQFDIEDLPAMMYIKKKLDGKKQKHMAKHIVIDEAQDYSAFQIFVLKEILENESMTILGDIAQGIYSYRGTNDWNYINEMVFGDKANIVVLDKSYRTTMEIMNLGNSIIEKANIDSKFTKAVPVIRNGVPIQIQKKNSFSEIVASIKSTLNQLVNERKNIAIITKNFAEAKKIHKSLSSVTDMNIQIVSEKVKDYQGGIVVIPSYLSKGLEFDSVIITNANDEMYLENEMDAKLLYVAVTRAMHTLNIFYTGDITKLISK